MSLITYPVATMPRVFLPRSFSAGLQTNTRGFASPFGGSEQVADMLNDRWAFALELAARNHDEAASVEAFVAAMRGMSNTTNLYHFGRPTPRGTLAGSPALVAPAAQGAASITVGAVAGQTLRAGDMLGIGGLLVQVAADCVADASGAMVVPLVNRLRRAVAGLSRVSTATYIDDAGVLQTAGVNVPRFQGGALLVEGAGTNVAFYSGSVHLWTKSSAGTAALPVTTENFAAAPSGDLEATRVVFSKGAGATSIDQSTLTTLGPGTVVGQPTCAFVYMRSNTADSYQVRVDFNGAGSTDAVSYPNTVTVTTVWQRFEIRLSNSFDTSRRMTVRLRGSLGTSDYADVLIWGGQQEIAVSASSYIPTTTAPATRAADVVTPVVWDRPTGTFRLASQPRVVYLGGYAEAVAMDFVEGIA